MPLNKSWNNAKETRAQRRAEREVELREHQAQLLELDQVAEHIRTLNIRIKQEDHGPLPSFEETAANVRPRSLDRVRESIELLGIAGIAGDAVRGKRLIEELEAKHQRLVLDHALRARHAASLVLAQLRPWVGRCEEMAPADFVAINKNLSALPEVVRNFERASSRVDYIDPLLEFDRGDFHDEFQRALGSSVVRHRAMRELVGEDFDSEDLIILSVLDAGPAFGSVPPRLLMVSGAPNLYRVPHGFGPDSAERFHAEGWGEAEFEAVATLLGGDAFPTLASAAAAARAL